MTGMAPPRAAVEASITSFLKRADKPTDIDAAIALFGDEGLGLDSLEAAELSSVLEDDLGSDPFSAGALPQTIGEIFSFYGFEAA
ncbi:hypothetical protein [uncultured Jatrophihabitans sp.]|uniref:hypothetical protein n=1 Tax=uncultured Jatrophihabitans sp. TaxID=1610747 RepID=UPI0035CA24D9